MQDGSPQLASTSSDDEIDLVDLFMRLWTGKFLIGCFVLIAGFLGVVFALNTQPVYEADGLLQLEEKAGQLALPDSLAELSAESPRAVTEIEIIRSRMVIGRAVARLNLDWQAEPLNAPVLGHLMATREIPLPDLDWLNPYAQPGDIIELELLDVPPEWVGEEIYVTAGANNRFEVSLPDGSALDGLVGEPILDEQSGFSLLLSRLEGEVGRRFVVLQKSETKAIADVRNGLSVTEQGRNSGILRLTYKAATPEMARRTLDAIAQAYLSQNADRSAAEADNSLAFVESQLPDAREAVEAAEAAVNEFRESQSAINLSAEGEALLTQIRTLETELVDLSLLEDELAERYTRNHPEYQRLLANRTRIEERLEEVRAEVRALPVAQREIVNLTQDLELAREVFVQLRNRAQELQVLRASTIGNVRILDTARASVDPISPRKTLIVGVAILLGFVAGAGFVLMRSYLRKYLEGAEELENLGLPVFATLNHHPLASKSYRGRKSVPLVALETPDDLFVEGLRSLRTSLHFAQLDTEQKSVLITSPAPGVGKSFVAANLAVVAAEAGQRVCLVDADLRRGTQHKYFGIPKAQLGLAQVLSSGEDVQDYLWQSSVENLYILPSGPFPPNPSELLMRKDLTSLLATLDERFDLVIIDAPPVLAVTDPVILGRSAGAILAVTRFGQTHPAEVMAVVKTLGGAGVKLSGAILNDFDPRKARTSDRYNYAYNTRYSYKSKAD